MGGFDEHNRHNRTTSGAHNNRMSYKEQEEDIDDAPTPNHAHARNNTSLPRIESIYLGICLFATFLLMMLSSVWTESPIFYTFLGFLPTIATIALLRHIRESDFKDGLVWVIPFVTGFLFLIFAGLLNLVLEYQLNVGGLTVINIVLGFVIIIGLVLLEGRSLLPQTKEVVVTQESIGDFIHSIEDKCKALNFVIGRAYRMSNGGSKDMRERLRINNEWYNDFHSLASTDSENDHEAKEKQETALIALHKIHDRLSLLLKKEKEAFSEQELKGLKHLARNKDGEDRIIDVLIRNDRDPVESYYVGAVTGARKILETLEEK